MGAQRSSHVTESCIDAETIRSWQIDRVLVNQGIKSLWPVEAGLLAGEHLTEQMLALAVVLTGNSKLTNAY